MTLTAPHVAALARASAAQFVREWNGDGHLTGDDLDLFEKETLRAHVNLLHEALGVLAVHPEGPTP